MRAVITKITPWFPHKVNLQWDLEAISSVGVFHFDVERSGSPGGPWTTVVTGLHDVYLYEDDLTTEKVNVLALNRDLYYRIKSTPPTGPVVYSDPVNLEGQTVSTINDHQPVIGYTVDFRSQVEPNPVTGIMPRPGIRRRKRLLRRKILRDEYIVLRALNGIEFFLLKRRHFGTRCTVCYDPASRRVLRSACPACYGTSWTNGYFTPILLLGRKLPSQIQTQEAPQAKVEVNQTKIQFLDFPRIDEEDVLIEKNTNKRFLVMQRYFTSLKTIPIHQTITVSEFERQAVEYNIPVDL
jgi:hypothetical protein